ncbi:MAG: aminoglycoside phosphotransferase family protein [Rhodanobacteraceae bacterium]|nr:MAG: aminoglycoside phosphotransferase family protein [Rhodanobacteraceae bacterium]
MILPATPPEHPVHGLAGTEVAPDWPALTRGEVEAVLAGYPALAGRATLLWHSPRPFSAAARVATRAGEVFVKRHPVSVRTPRALAEEHAFMAHLRARGIPVPLVLANAQGATAIQHRGWTYEVHALAAGVDLYRDSFSWSPLEDAGRARAAGRMLAWLHRAAAGFDATTRTPTVLVSRDDVLRAPDVVAAVAAEAAHRPALADYLQRRDWRRELQALVPWHRAVQPRLAGLPRLWTHNDWHVSNLCWTGRGPGAGVAAVLDFGLAAPTFALYDLATAIERNAVAWLALDGGMDAVWPQTANALIDGYAEVLPRVRDQRALIADLLRVVHIDFALSELEYFHGITHSAANADAAWHTFLLGHAAWFATPPGTALLAAIRGAA